MRDHSVRSRRWTNSPRPAERPSARQPRRADRGEVPPLARALPDDAARPGQTRTYVEGVWYDQAITGRTYAEIGIPRTPDASFRLRNADTIESVRARYREACAASRKAVAKLDLDDVVTGRGERPLWAIHLHVLRETARHCGHADILREQVLARRRPSRVDAGADLRALPSPDMPRGHP
jgi:Protein of unknown function (DUF664)